MIFPFTVGLMKKIYYKYIVSKMSQYFPKLCERSIGNGKVELDLFNY